MKDKMLVNLFENRLAFPLKNYPKKPTGTAGRFDLDGSFTINSTVCCWLPTNFETCIFYPEFCRKTCGWDEVDI